MPMESDRGGCNEGGENVTEVKALAENDSFDFF